MASPSRALEFHGVKKPRYLLFYIGFGPHPRPPWGPHGGGESTFESPGGGGFGPLTPWGFGGVLHDFLSFSDSNKSTFLSILELDFHTSRENKNV